MTLETEIKMLTDEQKREFCLMISIGCDRETACKYLACTYQQLQEAMLRDVQFVDQLLRAEATPEFSHMRNLYNAAKDEKHWRASVWWLERCAPERYARRSAEVVSAAELRRVIKALSAAIEAEISSQQERERFIRRLNSIAQSVEVDQLSAFEEHSDIGREGSIES